MNNTTKSSILESTNSKKSKVFCFRCLIPFLRRAKAILRFTFGSLASFWLMGVVSVLVVAAAVEAGIVPIVYTYRDPVTGEQIPNIDDYAPSDEVLYCRPLNLTLYSCCIVPECGIFWFPFDHLSFSRGLKSHSLCTGDIWTANLSFWVRTRFAQSTVPEENDHFCNLFLSNLKRMNYIQDMTQER